MNLQEAFNRYLEADTSKKQSAAKGLITRAVNERALIIGAVETRQEVWGILNKFLKIPDWMQQRFTPGSLYQEGNQIMGWWSENQTQAEKLPLSNYGWYSVSWNGFSKEIVLWKERGFAIAEELPVKFYPREIEVSFDVKKSGFWLEHGYALPCQLQWNRGQWDDGGTCLWVHRSIFSAGYQQAWKWWDTAKWWYLEKRPELFADMDWWGEPLPPPRFEPEEDPYAAVLGGQP